MPAEEIAGVVAVLAIVAYTAFGGADFGGGVWTLFASGPRKEDQRSALERAIGPVWETNHVWLILLVVTLFVVFPTAYAAIFTALYVPLFVALVGIVARGAAFAFRHYGDRNSRLSHLSLRAFSMASVLTPFVFGLCVGAVASGDIQTDGPHVSSGAFAGWLSPFAIMTGSIGLLLCAFLGAAYMIPRTEGPLRNDFRRRALVASLALGLATTIAIPVAGQDAAEFYDRLGRASVVASIASTAILGVVALVAIWRGAVNLAPVLAAATASGVVVTWALAQRPDLIVPGLTLEAAAAPYLTVKSFLVALPIGALILVPSLVLLYTTFSRDVYRPDSPEH